MSRVYLAGPMSGIENFNKPAFNAMAARLRAQGHHVENPAEIEPPADPTWESYMRAAVMRMLTCEVIALLPGWEKSRGAKIEHGLATEFCFEIWFLSEQADLVTS